MIGPEDQLKILKKGVSQIINEESLLSKLRLNRPLKVKLGIDPTSPDIHLGFTVALQKLRQFQDLGHLGVLIIGDFTAMIGDPTGRSKMRPRLSYEDVRKNAETFKEQAFKILHIDRTKVVYNGDWFKSMTFEEVMRLNGRVTIQQMLQREDFKGRIERGESVYLHEIQYPIMQGWDSVMVKADVEIGGTDQLFNILVGRDLQREEKQPEQVVLLMPLLEGLDGVQKMSKSLGNYVGVSEPPEEMFGKLMSISDVLMERYYLLLLGQEVPAIHPMEAKKRLAFSIVERYHSTKEANRVLSEFELRFSKRDLESIDLPEVSTCDVVNDLVGMISEIYTRHFSLTKSRGEIRRLIEQGSIRISNKKILNPNEVVTFVSGDVLRLDKKCAVRIKIANENKP